MLAVFCIFLFLILCVILLVRKWHRSDLQKKQFQLELLMHENHLLREVIAEQDIRLRNVNVDLHSHFKSHIHAIDLALFRLKKQLDDKRDLQIIQETLELTASSLQFLDQCADYSPFPALLDSIGLFPALEELFSLFEASIQIHVHPQVKIFQFAPSQAVRLYELLKKWLEQSIEEHLASEVVINWRLIDEHWLLVYKDNASYACAFEEENMDVVRNLVVLQANIQYSSTSFSGKTLILTGTF